MNDMNTRGAAYKIQITAFACAAAGFFTLAIYSVAMSQILAATCTTLLAVVSTLRCRYLSRRRYTNNQDPFVWTFYAVAMTLLFGCRNLGVPEDLVQYSTIALLFTSVPILHDLLAHVRKGRGKAQNL